MPLYTVYSTDYSYRAAVGCVHTALPYYSTALCKFEF